MRRRRVRRLHRAGGRRADLSRTGMLWAALARSPEAAGQIRAIDPVPALRIDGVLEVVTAADVPDLSRPSCNWAWTARCTSARTTARS
ncbi:hypothetical protein [Candidatus Poriferisodalis sp.]|uniref:hypothetical protein n=1 Tax=Candidatus Poriferisodalis sp. TaxID=3101277 RepID=UPI003B0124DC